MMPDGSGLIYERDKEENIPCNACGTVLTGGADAVQQHARKWTQSLSDGGAASGALTPLSSPTLLPSHTPSSDIPSTWVLSSSSSFHAASPPAAKRNILLHRNLAPAGTYSSSPMSSITGRKVMGDSKWSARLRPQMMVSSRSRMKFVAVVCLVIIWCWCHHLFWWNKSVVALEQSSSQLARGDIDTDPRYSSQPAEAARYKAAPVRAAIVVLAPSPNSSIPYWGHDIWLKRRYVLLNALQSIDNSINSKFNYSYPIIVFHEDWEQEHMTWLRREIKTFITFAKINLHQAPCYASADQIDSWVLGDDGAVAGRNMGYRMMCRAWSGIIQRHPVLAGFDVYMRLDDDSAIWRVPNWDIFAHVRSRGLLYAYYSSASDVWGIDQMFTLHSEFIDDPQKALQAIRDKKCSDETLPDVNQAQLLADFEKFDLTTETSLRRLQEIGYLSSNGRYNGKQPYNNFHISELFLWRTDLLKAWFSYLDLGFLKFQFGDANTHALIIGSFLRSEQVGTVRGQGFVYQHNTNVAPRKHWVNATIVALSEAQGDPERSA